MKTPKLLLITLLFSLGTLHAEQESTVEPEKKDAFIESIEDSLVILDSKKFKDVKDFTPPNKYYVFYKTASWCPPCQRFTPTLVEFYDKYKATHGDDFEIILVTSDQDEQSMLNYSIQKKMKWPQIDIEKVGNFSAKHSLPGSGIPNLLVCDREGNILKKSYDVNEYVGPLVPMEYLKALLDKENQ